MDMKTAAYPHMLGGSNCVGHFMPEWVRDV